MSITKNTGLRYWGVKTVSGGGNLWGGDKNLARCNSSHVCLMKREFHPIPPLGKPTIL